MSNTLVSSLSTLKGKGGGGWGSMMTDLPVPIGDEWLLNNLVIERLRGEDDVSEEAEGGEGLFVSVIAVATVAGVTVKVESSLKERGESGTTVGVDVLLAICTSEENVGLPISGPCSALYRAWKVPCRI
jgi:hypothetical protein